MKSFHLSLLLLISIDSALAQQPYPSNIKPLEGTLTLRYQPGYQSKCTTKFQPLLVSNIATPGFSTYEIIQDTNGHQQLQISAEYGTVDVRINFEIEKGGAGISDKKPAIETNTPALKLLRQDELDFFLSEHKDRASVVGKPLNQHSVTGRNPWMSCDEMGQATISHISSYGSFNILGVAIIDGKESVVRGGERGIVCSINKQKVTVNMRGWDSFDKVSGLPSNGSWIVHSDGGPSKNTITITQECLVSRK